MDWVSLPDHILVSILSFLPLDQRCKAALACKSWAECFKSPYLWTSYNFNFYEPDDERHITCVTLYGNVLRSVNIILDQASTKNHTNACSVLHELTKLENKRLKRLLVKFTGENPLFYAGLEFVIGLKDLFGSPWSGNDGSYGLTHVDLSGLYAALDDQVIGILAKKHPNLEKLNIQNKVLICRVTPASILDLVRRCCKLKDLQVFQCSVSEDVMIAFTEEDRSPLQHLSLFCRREEKYGFGIGESIWEQVVAKLPDLRVTLWFDHTCPLLKVGENMRHNIPCRVLRLETFSTIHDEINLATAYYQNTLEKLVVSTTPSQELNDALLALSAQCTKLNTLHVFCLLQQTTVERILEQHPIMKEKGWYTLKYVMEPHPWIAGGNC